VARASAAVAVVNDVLAKHYWRGKMRSANRCGWAQTGG
jgi:hypothetical protein